MKDKYKKYLEDFRDLKINQKELYDFVTRNNEKLIIYSKDLINVLNQYKKKHIDQKKLLEWVNTVWFSDLFTYDENDRNCIIEIMHALEELDERKNPLSQEEVEQYINALKANKIIPFRANTD